MGSSGLCPAAPYSSRSLPPLKIIFHLSQPRHLQVPTSITSTGGRGQRTSKIHGIVEQFGFAGNLKNHLIPSPTPALCLLLQETPAKAQHHLLSARRDHKAVMEGWNWLPLGIYKPCSSVKNLLFSLGHCSSARLLWSSDWAPVRQGHRAIVRRKLHSAMGDLTGCLFSNRPPIN